MLCAHAVVSSVAPMAATMRGSLPDARARHAPRRSSPRDDLLATVVSIIVDGDRQARTPPSRFPGGSVAVLDRTGGGDHFHVTVESAAFDVLPLRGAAPPGEPRWPRRRRRDDPRARITTRGNRTDDDASRADPAGDRRRARRDLSCERARQSGRRVATRCAHSRRFGAPARPSPQSTCFLTHGSGRSSRC